MNILPKKRWHVRTKENIARVRKDEAEAAEKERQERLRIEQADRECRINVLKQKSKKNLELLDIPSTTVELSDAKPPPGHINFFEDIEHAVSTTNKEHDQEVKEKKEEYEKKIGYLTYVGQDTNEALGKKNWYEILPDSSRYSRPTCVRDTYDKLVLKDEDGKPKAKQADVKDGEIGWKSKQRHDPIHSFKKHLTFNKSSSNKHKISENISKKVDLKSIKHKKQTGVLSHKQLKLQKLREARLKREQHEKLKTEKFLSKLNGEQTEEEKEVRPKVMPKYNSQFNPELARQNFR